MVLMCFVCEESDMKGKLRSLGLGLCMVTSAAWGNPYEDYRGTTLRISWPALGHFGLAETVLEEFEAETGINVEVEAIPYLQLKARQIEEMSQPTGAFDLVSWVIMWKSEYAANGFLEPLQPMFDDPELADPEFNLGEIAGAYLISGGMVGGDKGYLSGEGATLYGLPYGAETSVLAYRRDIFEEHDITPPETYAQLSDAIERLHALGIPALTSRGRGGNDVTFAWLLHLGPMGGKIFDDNWEPVINTPAAIEAATFLRRVVETGPADIDTFNFGQSAFAFLSDGAAMYLDNMKIGGAVRDPNFSRFADDIGYLSHPRGARCSAETGGFSIGIPANSANKEAAFLLLQYLTSAKGDQRIFELGGDPIRVPTIISNVARRPEFGAIVGSLTCADIDWRPLIPEWDAIQNEVLGPALLEVAHGTGPIDEIMTTANDQLRLLMADAGYYD